MARRSSTASPPAAVHHHTPTVDPTGSIAAQECRRGGHEGSRRGPVNDRERTRNGGVARELKRAAHGPDQTIAAGLESRPWNLAKVGVAGSNPVVRSRKSTSDQQQCGGPRTGGLSCGPIHQRKTNETSGQLACRRVHLSHPSGFRHRSRVSPLGQATRRPTQRERPPTIRRVLPHAVSPRGISGRSPRQSRASAATLGCCLPRLRHGGGLVERLEYLTPSARLWCPTVAVNVVHIDWHGTGGGHPHVPPGRGRGRSSAPLPGR
jgi:hypothetical protein